ncbi:MAG: arabinan endo-1,5-alpha-L-arabinosidase [Acidimicrobiales bacterium]
MRARSVRSSARVPARRGAGARGVFQLLAAVLSVALVAVPPAAATIRSPRSHASANPSYAFVHDPSMIREGSTYYVFSTGDPAGVIGGGNIQIRVSTDLRTWRYIGTVFPTIPSWILQRVGPIPNLWAPDISFYHGLYHLYYAGSSFGSNTSVIALATNVTLDPSSPRYHWVDRGEVLSSGPGDNYNAIDPALVYGPSSSTWLAFGSFWGGIKLVSIDASTGKPYSASPRLYSLASTAAPDAEEGSYLTRHGSYYYLFVSAGFCCRGIASTYQVVVGRSKTITGPYVDANGTSLTQGGGTELLGADQGMIGPGSGSVYHSASTYLFDYHYYDAFDGGAARLQVRHLYWTSSGWPVTGPPLVPVPGAPAGRS